MDYLHYYDLESYLLETVSPRFQRSGSLSAFDLFSIVIWKANRAKPWIAKRLLSHGHRNLESAARALSAEIHAAEGNKAKFFVLVADWGFRLPTASAILAMLYPDDFTVYDVRACDQLRGFHNIQGRTNPESLWEGYTEFLAQVKEHTPARLSLRDKDRYLWGKAVAEQLKGDLNSEFGLKQN